MGKGRTALVVHGGPGRPHLKPWAGLETLTPSYRFIYYDQRGCGQSTRPIDRLDPRNYSQNVILVDRTLGLGAQIADIERIRQILGEERLILIGHSLSMGQQHDYRPALKNIGVPVLVIHGAKDLQSQEASRRYVNALPSAEIRVIENAEHFPFHTHPAEFSAAVAEFLGKVE